MDEAVSGPLHDTDGRCFRVITANWKCGKRVVFLFTRASAANTHLHNIVGWRKWLSTQVKLISKPSGGIFSPTTKKSEAAFIMHSPIMLPVSIWLDKEHLRFGEQRQKRHWLQATCFKILVHILKLCFLITGQSRWKHVLSLHSSSTFQMRFFKNHLFFAINHLTVWAYYGKYGVKWLVRAVVFFFWS